MGEQTTLGAICNFLSGNAWKAELFSDAKDAIPVIRIQNLGDNKNEKFVYWQHEYQEKYLVTVGDILVSLSGSFKAIRWNGSRGLLNQRIVKVVPNENVAPTWLTFFLEKSLLQIARMGRHALVSNVALSDLKNLPVNLPPFIEQQRIADILSRAEGIVRLRREAEKKAAELIPALFLDLFGDPAANPKEWPVFLLKDLVSFMSGGTPSKSREDFWQGDLPWVSPKDMKRECIYDSIDHVSRKILTETNIKLVPIGSLLIVVRGMILIHTVPVAKSFAELTINQDMKALTPISKINIGYLLWLMKVSQPKLLNLVATAAHGTKKLETERLENLRIPLPPLEMQVAFTEKVAQIESIQFQQSAATTKAQATFDALLARVFAKTKDMS